MSLLSVFCKLFERVIANRFSKLTFTSFPNKQQQGFQKALSCITAGFNLQETIYHNLEQNTNVYVAQLDIKGAFDSVWHDALFVKLKDLGIDMKLWRTLRDSYQNLKTFVKTSHGTSAAIDVKCSVRQGGVLSGFYYTLYINALLDELEKSGHGAMVGSIPSGNPTLADDISIVTTSPMALQAHLNIVQSYAKKYKFEVNVDKSYTIAFSYRRIDLPLRVTYNGTEIKKVDSTTHLGMEINSDFYRNSSSKIVDRCKKGKNAYHAMLGYGLQPKSLHPLTLCSIYNKVIKPTILYGSELWNDLKSSDIDQMNRTQHYIVKSIQDFPKLTRSDMCESMLGLNRLSSQVDDRKMRFVHKISTLPQSSITRQIFTRRILCHIRGLYPMKGFIPDIYTILGRYHMADILNVFMDNSESPPKCDWKRRLCSTIINREQNLWIQRIHKDIDFTLFRKIHTSVSPAVVWSFSTLSQDQKLSRFVSKIWVEKSVRVRSVCKLCENEYESKYVHILSECMYLRHFKYRLFDEVLHKFGCEVAATLEGFGHEQFSSVALGASCDDLSRVHVSEFYRCLFSFVKQTVTAYERLLLSH